MRTYFAAFALALVLCTALTPLIRYLAIRLGAVSTPGGRNLGQAAIPRLGGIAIAIASLAPLITLFVVDSAVATFVRQRGSLSLGLLVGGLVMCTVGVIDDTRGLRVRYKLLAQLSVAVLAHQLGFRIDGVAFPIVGVLPMGAFSLPVTVLWIVGVTNAVNLIDGLDGLAAGIVFCAAVTNLVVALATGTSVGPVFVALLMASIMGALLGFLIYNFNPARIYMGDSGSYFLGFTLASSSIMSPLQKHSTAVSLLVPMVALGIPIFDTFFSMLRRYLDRRPILSPDRGHLHHRLLDMGITHRRAVYSLYAVSVLFSGAAILVALGRDWEIGVALVGVTVVLFTLVRAVGYLDYARLVQRQRRGRYEARVQRLRHFTPQALEALKAATSPEHVRSFLGSLRGELGLAAAGIANQKGELLLEAPPLQTQGASLGQGFPVTDGARTGRLTLSYPVAGTDHQLVLHFEDDERPSAQVDILMQLLADALEQPLKLMF